MRSKSLQKLVFGSFNLVPAGAINRRRYRSRHRGAALRFEPLESRQMLSVGTWPGASEWFEEWGPIDDVQQLEVAEAPSPIDEPADEPTPETAPITSAESISTAPGPGISLSGKTLARLAAPSDLCVSNVLSGSLGLSWKDNSSNECGFYVAWSPNGQTWLPFASVGANSTGCLVAVTPNARYYFRVYAWNDLQTSDCSNVVSATTLPPFLGMDDVALADLTRTLYADGSIDRNDMIQILRSAGSDDGTVDATEIHDLNTILTAGWCGLSAAAYGAVAGLDYDVATLNIPLYVLDLAGKVVNGNRANAHYGGQPLGNLEEGSSNIHLAKLVNKWFLGMDHPQVPAMVLYRWTSGSLFVDGPDYTDMHQGALDDCYLLATLGSIAKSDPAVIENMFIDNGDDTWTVRFLTNDNQPDFVTVDRMFPITSTGYLLYANSGHYFWESSNELWLPLLEKAYAQWNETGEAGRDGKNDYESIGWGWMHDVCRQVLGDVEFVNSLAPVPQHSPDWSTEWVCPDWWEPRLIDAIQSNKAVTVGACWKAHGLMARHAYAVVGYDSASGTFQLHNPFGYGHPAPLTFSQLSEAACLLVVADTSGVAASGTALSVSSAALETAAFAGALGDPILVASTVPRPGIAPAATQLAGSAGRTCEPAPTDAHPTAHSNRPARAVDAWFETVGAAHKASPISSSRLGKPAGTIRAGEADVWFERSFLLMETAYSDRLTLDDPTELGHLPGELRTLAPKGPGDGAVGASPRGPECKSNTKP